MIKYLHTKHVSLIAFILMSTIRLFAQTTLSPGDMAIIGYNYDAVPQEMAIVTLVPISSGTVIRITDYGYDENTGAFGTTSTSSVNEGSIQWTTTSAIAAGTVIKFSITSGTTPSVSGLPGTVSITGWSNTISTTSPAPAGGDNWFIYQGSSATSVTTFVFGWVNTFAATFNGINQPAGQFLVSGSGSPSILNSYLPPSLSIGTSAIAVNRDPSLGGYHGDDNVYNGTHSGSLASLQSAICSVGNWLTNETTAYDLSVGGTYFGGSNPVFTVASSNSAPTDISISATSVNENVAANTTIGTLSSTDPNSGDTFTYMLVAGTGSTDNASFNISGSSLRITNSPDFETKSSYSVRVRSTDQGSLTFEKAFTITINDLNEAPTDIALSASSVNENVAANTTVGTLSSTDADASNTFTYTLVSGTGSTDNASFNISGSSLRITNSPDFETKSSYSVRVRSADQGSLTFEKVFTITINDLPENGSCTVSVPSSLMSNFITNSAGVKIGQSFTACSTGEISKIRVLNNAPTTNNILYIRDGDGLTGTILGSVSGIVLQTAATFTDYTEIDLSSANINVVTGSTYTFEFGSSLIDLYYNSNAGSVYQGGKIFYDGIGYPDFDLVFEVEILQASNSAPTDINLSASSVNENVAANTTIGTLSSTDPNSGDTFTYSLVSGTGSTDNTSFNISGSSLRITNSPDFEIKSSYNIRVRTTDQGSLTFEKAFTITINDLNEGPSVSSVSVPSNGTYIASQNLDFTVNFSENVTVNTAGGTPQLSITIGSTTRQAVYTSGSGTTALLFRYTTVSGDLDTDGIAIGTLSANGGTLRDATTNNANLTLNSVGSTTAVLVDAVAPTVSSVSVPSNGTYIAGQNLDYTVNFSENVTVNAAGGTPQLSITIGSTTRQAVYTSGSGTSALLFRYTVVSGELDTDGIAVGTLSANGGTLRDAATNNANLTLNSVGSTSSVLIDAVAPTVSSVSVPSNGTYIASQNLDFIVNFSENITVNTGGGTPQLSITIGSTTQQAVYTSGSGTTALLFRYTVVSGELDTDGIAIGTLSANGGTLRDAVTNDATLTLNSVGSTSSVLVDGVAPTVVSVSSSAANGTFKIGDVISIQVTFSEVVTGSGIPQLTLETGTTDRTINYSTGAGSSSFNFSYTVQSGDNTSDLDYTGINALSLNGGTIRDLNFNNAVLTLPTPGATNSLGANKAIVIDGNVPTASSFSPLDEATDVALNSNLSITFNENMAIGTGNLLIKKISDNSTVQTITATDNTQATVSGTTLTINPSSDLPAGTAVYINIPSGFIKDVAGNVYAGIADNSTWNFTTINNIGLSVDDPSVSEGNSGTKTLSFTVTLSQAAPAGGATVDYASSDGTASAGNDYTSVTGTLTFAAGETSKTVDVTISGDQTLEANETITLTLSNETGTNVIISDATGTGTITNDDAAAVTIANVNGNEDNGAITVTATLDNAVQGGFTVDVSTADGTATTVDGDYTAVSGQTLTFAGTAGETQTFTVTPTADTKLEANETVSVIQSNLAATALMVDITDGATVTFINDDAASVTIADVNGNEDDGAVTLTATLDYAVQGGFTVNVNTSDGTATTADGDYTAVSGQTLTFVGTAGETKTFTVTPTTDTKLEANETVSVSQSNLAATTLAVDITDGATVTINNDDAAAVTIANVNGNEDDGAITLTATLNYAVQGGFTVDVSTADGTATTADGDYTAVTGQTLTFAGTAGETQTFTVTPTADTKLEANETVSVSQSNLAATTMAVDITDGAIVTINNDDAAAVTIANVNGNEDDGAITLTATLDYAVQGGFTVKVSTSNGTATLADGDYTAVSGHTLTFAGTAGETQTFTVTPTTDTKLEANETVLLSQSNLASTTLAVDITDGATVTINNDDAAAVIIADVRGNEDDGAITVTATLDNAVQGGFTVDVSTADGTATMADNDYTAVTSQTLTFTGIAGETKTFTVTPSTDTKVESNETVSISQSNLAATTLLVDITDGATLTILNDDLPASVTNVNSSTANGLYKLSDVISIQITFSRVVNVTGTPQLQIETGATDRAINYASGSGSTVLNFSYTIQAGDESSDLDYTSVSGLTLNGGTIKDVNGTNAVLTLKTPGSAGSLGANKALAVDGIVPLPPSAPDLVDISDSGSSSTDDITNDNTPTFEGTAEANSTISITSSVDGLLGTTTANGSGDWSFTSGILTETTHSITAKATDAAGNTSVASSALAIEIDVTAPAAPSTPDLADASDTGSSNTDNKTNDNTPTFTGTSEVNAIVTVTSSVDGTLGSATADGSGNWSYTADTPITDATHLIKAIATDAAGNIGSESSALSIVLDSDLPMITITSFAEGIVNGAFEIFITLSKELISFTADDLAIDNGIVTKFSGSGTSFKATITPIGEGNVEIEVNRNRVQDELGNMNIQSNYFEIVYDSEAPIVSISSEVGAYTKSAFSVEIKFDERVYNFKEEHIIASNATVNNFHVVTEGLMYSVDIVPSNDGTVTVKVPSAVVWDNGLNFNATSNVFSTLYDVTPPSFSFTSELITVNAPFEAKIKSSEAVDDFTEDDISGSNAVLSSFGIIDETTFSILVTPSTEGIISIRIAKSVATDLAGNLNTQTASLDLIYDITAPEIICPEQIQVSENITSVITVSANDENPVTFSLTGGADLNMFKIDENSGELTFISAPDAENPQDFNLDNAYEVLITAFDGVNFKHHLLTVHILDANDNTPVINDPGELSVNEGTVENSLITHLTAGDADLTESTYTWIIESNVDLNENGTSSFGINSETGAIYILDPDDFDREKTSQLSISVSVSDGTNKSETMELIVLINDLNDETPIIVGNEDITINENTDNAKVIGSILFTDADFTTSEITDFKIVKNYNGNNNATNAFGINKTTGELFVTDSDDIDREEMETITIEVTVNDGVNTSAPAEVIIHITDLNDEIPVVSSNQFFSIDENSAAGTPIGTIAFSDKDVTPSNKKEWKMVIFVDKNMDGKAAVAINEETGELSINDAAEFDYELQNEILLTVIVSDGVNTSAEQQLKIIINNMNDESPVVEKGREFIITENSPKSTFVGKLTASDADGITSYSDWTIVDNFDANNNNVPALNMDASSGEINVNDPADLDFEQTTSFSIFVTVSDGVNTSEKQEVKIILKDVDETVNSVSLTRIDDQVNIYPVPVSDVLTVEAPLNSTVLIFDISGRLIRTKVQDNEKVKINVADLRKGKYLIRIQKDQTYTTRNILVE